MLKHGLEGVNLNNPIEDKLPQIIEYFVKFYGEKYRERIKGNDFRRTDLQDRAA